MGISLSEHLHRSLSPSYRDIFISQAVKGVSDGRGKLLDILTRMEGIFRRLETYIEVPLTTGMTDAIVEVMVEVVCVLGIMTKEIKQNRTSELTHCDRQTLLG